MRLYNVSFGLFSYRSVRKNREDKNEIIVPRAAAPDYVMILILFHSLS